MLQYDEVLIIEDNDTSIFLNQRVLQNANAFKKIVVKKNGLLALNYLTDKLTNSKELPTLLILDIKMPIMNGLEFLEHFRILVPSSNKKPCVVILTTSDLEIDQRIAEDLGISMYLNKSLNNQKMANILVEMAM